MPKQVEMPPGELAMGRARGRCWTRASILGSRRSVRLAVLALGLALSLIGAPAALASCPSVKLIGVRGSGETRSDGNGYGTTVDAVVNWLAKHSSIPAEYVDYQALAVEWWDPSYYTDRYNRSVGTGINSLLAHVEGFLNTCHSSDLVLAGYSQGAQVVADTYQQHMSAAEQARVIGIVLFGDPRFKGGQGAPIDVGSYDHSLNGIVAQTYHRRDWAAADASKVRSYCAEHDPVCNFSSLGSAVSCGIHNDCAHYHYMDLDVPGTSTSYTTAAAEFLLGRARSLNGEPGTTPGGTTPGGTTPGGTTPGGTTPGGTTPGGGSPAPTYTETTGSVAHTWTDYSDAGGTEGPEIGSNETVQIACWVTGFKVADGNTYWYEVASSPWNDAYYVSADAFYNNGETSGTLSGTPFVDPAVPACAGSSGGTGGSKPTYAETTGSVAHTWTDYADAGGTEGPEIASNQTVQIACWVSGFRVADGNTYWYEIGSSPWNDTYYVSADAFYNNGATSGSLLDTPFVDPAVPEC